jgi:hypothetical protein
MFRVFTSPKVDLKVLGRWSFILGILIWNMTYEIHGLLIAKNFVHDDLNSKFIVLMESS